MMANSNSAQIFGTKISIDSSRIRRPGAVRSGVSSVLNKDVKQFGKKHLVDELEETCWNSDQGSPQWISVELESPTEVCEIDMQFQGGFVGRDCSLEGRLEPGTDWVKLQDFYPQDKNGVQTFQLEAVRQKLHALKIVFNTSTDFFGRITIYKLCLRGLHS
ncbi:nuclear receptor 2C2-associated protein-like isoform X2 [Dreissena polymorpha]|uniref:nuclear receptor 2C2-associated protein-like isoform X2 n=1 Tax=Dreissena polymorpha TaxID=45954 RepID=UPI002264500F|nr:nuclear receptor 2C2-associated protein-like isoform X2 [Dreissena polymorpha]